LSADVRQALLSCTLHEPTSQRSRIDTNAGTKLGAYDAVVEKKQLEPSTFFEAETDDSEKVSLCGIPASQLPCFRKEPTS
jgi:hypothetical protein